MATGSTPTYNLPYPLLTDPVDVHGDIQELATVVENVLGAQLTSRIPKSDITAKGVILVGTGVGTYAAQSVGTNGQVLTANSAQADGVEWTTVSGYLAPTLGTTSIASGATVSTIAGLTLTSPIATTTSSSSIPLIVRGVASQSANLQEWRNSSGTVLLSVSPTGVLNATGTTNIGPVLTFANPGVGQDTRFNFTKGSDTAWLSVVERATDSTYYEFGMGDNPAGGDYFQWKFDNYEAPAQGWMPLQMGAMATRFTSAVSNWGSYSIPVNTPFTTLNSSATSSTDFQVNKYSPTNNTAQTLNKDSGTGTGIVTLNAQSFTGSSRLGYWIFIDAGGTTFTWGNGYTANTPVATGVTITGTAQTLSNGVTVTLSLTGHVSGDKWSFLCFPRPTVGIGGAPILTSMETVYPAASTVGVTVRGAASQASSLQQWQDSSGNVLSSISPTGQFVLGYPNINGINSSFAISVGSAIGTLNAANSTGYTSAIHFARGNTAGVWMNIGVTGDGSNGVASLDIRDGSNVRLLSVGNTGNTIISNISASVVSLTVKGHTSQTADLQQWQNSAGTVLAEINASGSLELNGKDIELMTLMGAF